MRILFTFVGGLGHFAPLDPIARGAVEAGHTVAFGCGPSMQKAARAAGFGSFALGSARGTRPARSPLRPVDIRREERDLRERFVRRAARDRVPHALALCAEWRPDLLVCDETDFGAIIAAERLGLPYATVQVIASGSFVRQEVVGEAIDELRGEHGLPPDPRFEMLSRYLVLSPFPRSFRDPAHPLPATAHAFRSAPAGPAQGTPPAWLSELAGTETLYLTLGTIFNTESGDLFVRALAGLRELPANIVVTVGDAIDPGELGPQPRNVRIVRYVPQAWLLPHCDLVVSHGGSGSVMGALAHGLPAVLIPMGADQPLNAGRCVALGVALALDAMTATPDSIHEAAKAVLAEPGFRANAGRLRDENAALPGLAHAVGLLERLAREKIPLHSS